MIIIISLFSLQDMDINSTLYTAIATDADVAGNALVSYFLEAVGLINGGGETCYNVNITSPSLCVSYHPILLLCDAI